MIDIVKAKKNIDTSKFFFATYFVESTVSIFDAAWNIAIGQSVGNPNVRSRWETDELFENHSAKIITDDVNALKISRLGAVEIAFPIINTNWYEDGISHLLCQLVGGQFDIETITRCNLVGLALPENVIKIFKGPKYGISGIRDYLGNNSKPILGAIIKPKTGISPHILLDMVKELVDGGVEFIKEDEILSNPVFCPLEKRVELIANYLESCGRKVIFSHCINGDSHVVINRAKKVSELGGNAIHINVWSGMGSFNAIRQLDLPMFIHFQKSGDAAFTNNQNCYSISWEIICYLAAISGVDTIHAGMWGGYKHDDDKNLLRILKILRGFNVLPALSCGMHPGLTGAIVKRFGSDFLSNVGGAIHGHPNGTTAGAVAMRQSIDGNYGVEYRTAIEKWGEVI